VSFAHQRGIIHRDLKPANILVAASASSAAPEPQPKVLDFGIAKRTTGEVNLASMQTHTGQIIGTLAYMSPEQVAGHSGDIDTRTDVYALGLILFEILSGRLPIDVTTLSIPEAVRRIAESQPVHLATLDERFRGDLDTIVHKAIAKDKTQRYDTVSEFAADLRRYLRDEPIAARPPSTMYQLRKFAQRNRVLAASVAIVAGTLVAAVIATTMLAVSATRARAVAERKTLVAEGVSGVLLNALTTATPKGSVGKEPLLIDAIDRIESQVATSPDGSGAARPEVQAVVYNIVGIIHRERGDLAHAETLFARALEIRERVLDPGDPNLADSINNMGLLRRRQDRPAEAAVFYERAVALQRQSSFRDDARLARNLFNLASAYIAAGEVAKALPPLQESLVMHEALPSISAEVLNYHISARARIALEERQFARAKSLAQEALSKQRDAVGASHPTVALCLVDLGRAHMGLGEFGEAVARLREAESMAIAIFPTPKHHVTRTIRVALIEALRGNGEEAAAQEVEQALAASP
jgi:tetratricopeptide (TPR) repeat protein